MRVKELEEQNTTTCDTCGIEINTYGKVYIKSCKNCYDKKRIIS
jgi:tRNA(Ile2) C34 agmatinyltransferase TiaS